MRKSFRLPLLGLTVVDHGEEILVDTAGLIASRIIHNKIHVAGIVCQRCISAILVSACVVHARRKGNIYPARNVGVKYVDVGHGLVLNSLFLHAPHILGPVNLSIGKAYGTITTTPPISASARCTVVNVCNL